ncbi:hypothetical protein [Paenibacillus lupini]|uniref:hypothetical protein n=2 Tax=Paenibacillus lupini TaxID=1450204 RepID=UPI001421492D|nr:hypothetical protein [Paenibacillus lupini]NIK21510.1 hypothetical protein [Paenibacillus lupini]
MNNFTIKSFAPYSLNYLIYIQNAFISSKGESRKFPSLDIVYLGLLEEGHFCDAFKKVWSDMIRLLSQNSLFDHNGVLENEMFQTLFKPNDQGIAGYEESKRSFNAWFSSLTGQITIERAADHMMYYEMDIYNRVSKMINNDENRSQELLISLIYDECIMGESERYSRHSIVSLQDLYFKKEDLVSNIVDRWNRGNRTL